MVFSPRLVRRTAQAALHSRPEIYSGNKGLENLTSATPLYVLHMTLYLALYVLRTEGLFCTVLPFTVFFVCFLLLFSSSYIAGRDQLFPEVFALLVCCAASVGILFTDVSVCCSAVRSGTALKAGRSPVAFLMKSLKFFIYLIFPASP